VLAPRSRGAPLVYEADLAERIALQPPERPLLPGLFNSRQRADIERFARRHSGRGSGSQRHPVPGYRAVYNRCSPRSIPACCSERHQGPGTRTLLRISEVIRRSRHPRASARVAVLSGPPSRARLPLEPNLAGGFLPGPRLEPGHPAGLLGPTFRVYPERRPGRGKAGRSALRTSSPSGRAFARVLGLGSNNDGRADRPDWRKSPRLAVAAGGQPATLAGLAGLGDLVLTATGHIEP